MTLPTDARLGPYQLLALLGAGGMGEVYKARDTRLDRTVALKILPEQFADDPDRRERFEREARAVAALNHPHICDLHDIGEDQSVRFLVMEYLEGQTLAERVLRGPLPPAEVLRCAIELADALDHAHRHGLVHRDLKPGNVMLTRSGAKLLDFGLSKLQTTPDLVVLSTLSPAGGPLTAEGACWERFRTWLRNSSPVTRPTREMTSSPSAPSSMKSLRGGGHSRGRRPARSSVRSCTPIRRRCPHSNAGASPSQSSAVRRQAEATGMPCAARRNGYR